MRKSKVIATCLVNSRMIETIKMAEAAVYNIFQDEFPNHSFTEWNTNIPDKTAKNIIDGVGIASRINVMQFIKDLWQ